MEFLRFGSSIPGAYWGCCAADIIQDFNQAPDSLSSIELVDGDGGTGTGKWAGPTYQDIFETRIKIGTFHTQVMPNHAFIAILTQNQVNGSTGKRWLKILKANGFEFIRTVCNSVYSGPELSDTPGDDNQNHIFALFRNIGYGNITDPFTPPKAWQDLPTVVPEAVEYVSDGKKFADEQREAQRQVWDSTPKPKFLTRDEVKKAGAPVILAGKRGGIHGTTQVGFPQQSEEQRNVAKEMLPSLVAALVKKKPEMSMKGAPDPVVPILNINFE